MKKFTLVIFLIIVSVNFVTSGWKLVIMNLNLMLKTYQVEYITTELKQVNFRM